MRLRLPAPIAIVAGAVLGLAPDAGAVTREQAVAAAVAGDNAPGAVVYATPAPLRRGARVAEAGPGTWSVGKPRRVRRVVTRNRIRPWRVRRAAWLVWQDYAPGAFFAHAGRLTLVDDPSGRVLRRSRTAWWPRVDGRDPPGFGSSPRRFALTVAAGTPPAPPVPRASAAQDTGDGEPRPPLPALPRDCLVTIGDRVDPIFTRDFDGLALLADELNIPHWPLTTTADLKTVVPRARQARCNDVIVAVIGHGFPPPGWTGGGLNEDAETAQATVGLKWNPGKWLGVFPTNDGEYLRYDHLRDLVDEGNKHGIKFKLVIEACFSGRFAPLASRPGVAVVATASGPTELGWAPMPADKLVGTTVLDSKLLPGTGPPIGGADDVYGGIINQIVQGVPNILREIGPNVAAAIHRAVQNDALSVPMRLKLTHPRAILNASGRIITSPSRYTTITVVNTDMNAGEVIGSVHPTRPGDRCSPASMATYCGIKCGPFAQYCKVELAPGSVIGLGGSAVDRSKRVELDCPGSDRPPACFYEARDQGRSVTVTARYVPAKQPG